MTTISDLKSQKMIHRDDLRSTPLAGGRARLQHSDGPRPRIVMRHGQGGHVHHAATCTARFFIRPPVSFVVSLSTRSKICSHQDWGRHRNDAASPSLPVCFALPHEPLTMWVDWRIT
jgi:hypothetical protein